VSDPRSEPAGSFAKAASNEARSLDEADQTCADLQAQMRRAHEFMDQSRRFLRAAAAEPRSFNPKT